LIVFIFENYFFANVILRLSHKSLKWLCNIDLSTNYPFSSAKQIKNNKVDFLIQQKNKLTDKLIAFADNIGLLSHSNKMLTMQAIILQTLN